MKKLTGPTTIAGWKRRCLKAERSIQKVRVESMLASVESHRIRAEAITYHRNRAEAFQSQVFQATSANSRYVRQDNAVRKAVAGAQQTGAEQALVAIAKALDMPARFLEPGGQPPNVKPVGRKAGGARKGRL